MYNAELQMLREFAWFWMPKIPCAFCGKPLLTSPGLQTFGHRRHPKVRERVTVHHENENRSDNSDGNLKWCHRSCHAAYHRRVIQHIMKGE